jgi:hypothetical protein
MQQHNAQFPFTVAPTYIPYCTPNTTTTMHIQNQAL